MKTIRTRSLSRLQRGVYALEFAVVFMIFFSILYAIICYGMLFAFRLSLQDAAEDGARAVLQYRSSIEDRKKHAADVATARSGWMPQVTVSAKICRVEGINQCAPITCGPSWSQRCQVEVLVQANDLGSLLPPLPSFAVPTQIAGNASMLLDLR